eukprot:15480920-Alexandrium_andersonii.AAC.1
MLHKPPRGPARRSPFRLLLALVIAPASQKQSACLSFRCNTLIAASVSHETDELHLHSASANG